MQKKNLGFPRFFLIRLELSLFAAVDVENQLAGQFIQSGVVFGDTTADSTGVQNFARSEGLADTLDGVTPCNCKVGGNAAVDHVDHGSCFRVTSVTALQRAFEVQRSYVFGAVSAQEFQCNCSLSNLSGVVRNAEYGATVMYGSDVGGLFFVELGNRNDEVVIFHVCQVGFRLEQLVYGECYGAAGESSHNGCRVAEIKLEGEVAGVCQSLQLLGNVEGTSVVEGYGDVAGSGILVGELCAQTHCQTVYGIGVFPAEAEGVSCVSLTGGVAGTNLWP